MTQPPDTQRFAILACLIAGTFLLTACGKSNPRTVSEIQETYAQQFIDGMDFGINGTITAEGFDRTRGELVSVRLDMRDEGIIFAKRAAILIDPKTRTMRLQLLFVTAASPGGGLVAIPDFSTDPVKLDYPVVAEAQ